MKLFALNIALLLPFHIHAQTTAADSLNGKVDTAHLIFCGGIENDLPVGISDKFFMDTTGSDYIYAYYSQSEPLMMKQVLMEIRPGNDSIMQAFMIKPKWRYTFLKCYFPSSGNYRVRLYDEKKNILAEGKVTIADW